MAVVAGSTAASRPTVLKGPPLPGHKKALPENVPEGLKPRLRIFLSVDLVGSTPFKQSRPEWRPEILNFYRDFDFILYKHHREFSRSLEGALSAPEFWKSNGDELLYTWELQNLAHAHAIMHIWVATLEEYRTKNSAGARLDVKSTAWMALFPVPNSEIFFRRGGNQTRAADTDDALLLQSEMRDDWYANGASYEFTKEYVGPSIDTGFRLTSWASPRRLILSVDLAFLLTSLFVADANTLVLHLSGKDKLKGVIDNAPYPTIWIPIAGGARAGPESGRIDQSITDPAMIRATCEAIIEQNYKFITPIFLSFSSHEDFEWVPPYILKQIKELWQEENHYKASQLERLAAEG
jgi:hypothetical protein